MPNSKKLQQLVAKLEKHRQAYARGEPLISDVEYDALEAQLQQQAPDHPLLQQPGVKTSATTKATHAVPMLSLQKTYSVTELESWRGEQPVVGTLKIDGNSLSLVYRGGKLLLAKTRGDGQRGENVTAKMPYITAIPTTISSKAILEVRGELYCATTAFYTLATEMEQCGLPRPLSPRNVVAGLLGRKEQHQLLRHFNFMACNLLSDDDSHFQQEIDKLTRLTTLGFTLPEPQLLTARPAIETYLEQVRRRLDEDELPLDGVVFSFNDLAYARELGSTTHHPRGRMAFKWQGETAVATITDIVWHTSRFGIVTPVAIIEPVFLNNASIRRVTLHNCACVKLYNLQRGTKIKIVRSGEVIPKFLAVVAEGSGKAKIPTTCPSCKQDLQDDGVRLLCGNDDCPAQLLRTVLNWVKCADIKDLSEKRLAAMMALGLVKSIPDLYRLSKDDLLRVPLTGERMASKLHTAITASKRLAAEQLLSGLGIRGGGRATWRALLRVAPTIEALSQLSAEEISAIDGFAEKSAQQIQQGLQQRQTLLSELLACGIEIITPATPAGGKQQGQKYVISGSLSQPRAFYQQLLEKNGATLASSVSAKTTAVVTADPASTSTKGASSTPTQHSAFERAGAARTLGRKTLVQQSNSTPTTTGRSVPAAEEQFANAERGAATPAGRGLFGFDIAYHDCALIVLAVPWELSVSHGHGTATAPAAILQASHEIDLFNFGFAHQAYRNGIRLQELHHPVIDQQKQLLANRQQLSHAQNIHLRNELSHALNQAIYDTTATLHADGKKVILLGGDHSIPFGFLQQLSKHNSSFGILHLDAHFDYRHAYQGLDFSHASIMYQVMTHIETVSRIVHVGIRDFCVAEYEFARSLGARAQLFFDRDLHRHGFANIVDEIVAQLPQQIYISFDIDALDPSLCPHTGTPVPGGLSFNDVLLLCETLHASGRSVIGADLCETVPAPNHWDENVAARLLYQLAALLCSASA